MSPDSEAQGAEPRRTVGGGATLASLSAVGAAAAGGLLGVVVARLLGPADTGEYNVAAATLLIGMVFFAVGVNVGATYLVSQRRWAPGDAFRHVQLAAAVTGAVGCGVGIAALALGRDTIFAGVPVEVVLIALAGIPFALSWTHSAAIYLALDRYETFALAPFLNNVVALALAALLIPLVGLTGAVTALAGAHAVTAAWLVARSGKALPPAQPGWFSHTGGQLREAVSFGFKSYLPQALQLLNYRADIFILNAFAASATVGHYAVALLVTEVGFLLPRSLAAVVMPRVAALDTAAGGDEQQMVIVKSARHSLVLAPGIAVVLAIGVFAIPLVFGSDFEEAIGPGLILIPGVVAVGLSNVLSAAVVGRGFPQYALYGALLATPITLGLYFALIPSLEATGAALASTASYLLTTVITLFYFQRTIRLSSLAELLPRREDMSDYRELWARGRRYVAEHLGRARS